MAIILDNVGTMYQDTDYGKSGATLSFTVANNSNRILIVSVLNSNRNTTGVTYNGVAMTNLYGVNGSKSFWYLLNPSVGTYNIVASFSSYPTGGSLNAISYYGVDSIGAWNMSTNNYISSLTTTITPTKKASLLLAMIYCADSLGSVGSGQTLRLDSAPSYHQAGFSDKPNTSLAANSLSWAFQNATGSNTSYLGVLELVDVVQPAGTNASLLYALT